MREFPGELLVAVGLTDDKVFNKSAAEPLDVVGIAGDGLFGEPPGDISGSGGVGTDGEAAFEEPLGEPLVAVGVAGDEGFGSSDKLLDAVGTADDGTFGPGELAAGAGIICDGVFGNSAGELLVAVGLAGDGIFGELPVEFSVGVGIGDGEGLECSRISFNSWTPSTIASLAFSIDSTISSNSDGSGAGDRFFK